MSLNPISNSSFVEFFKKYPFIISFLDPNDVRALAATSTYVLDFFQNDTMQYFLSALHFPLSLHIAPRDANGRLASEFYRRCTIGSINPAMALQNTFTVNSESLRLPQLTPDGKKLITPESASEVQKNNDSIKQQDCIALYELDTGIRLWNTFLGFEFKRCAISPDQNRLLVLSHKRKENPEPGTKKYVAIFNLIDLETGKILQTFEDPQDFNIVIQFSKNGNTLYTGTFYNTVNVWDLQTAQFKGTFEIAEEKPPLAIIKAIINDGKTAISLLENGSFLLWETATGKKGLTLLGHPQDSAITSGATYFQVSEDETKALSFSPPASNTICIWDLKTGEARAIHKDHLNLIDFPQIKCSHATPDLKRLVLGSPNGDIVLVDLKQGRTLCMFNAHNCEMHGIQIKPDGLGVVSTVRSTKDHTLENKNFTFCDLPENRLASLARNYLSDLPKAKNAFGQLPRFGQDELNAISQIISSETVDIYAATKVSLQPIRRLFRRAEREPHLAHLFISEAFRKIRELSPDIGKAVARHFHERVQEKNNPWDNLAKDGQEAITATVADFIAQRAALQQEAPPREKSCESKKD